MHFCAESYDDIMNYCDITTELINGAANQEVVLHWWTIFSYHVKTIGFSGIVVKLLE